MCVIEINESSGRAVNEDAVAGARISVAHDLVSIPQRAIHRCVMELTKQAGSTYQLCV
jgi:hypothetical protein